MEWEIRERAALDREHVRDMQFDRTNLERVLNGRDMAASAATRSGYLAYEDYESGLVDALANLMHFARRYEIDFDHSIDVARRHHDTEARYDWDEVPE